MSFRWSSPGNPSLFQDDPPLRLIHPVDVFEGGRWESVGGLGNKDTPKTFYGKTQSGNMEILGGTDTHGFIMGLRSPEDDPMSFLNSFANKLKKKKNQFPDNCIAVLVLRFLGNPFSKPGHQLKMLMNYVQDQKECSWLSSLVEYCPGSGYSKTMSNCFTIQMNNPRASVPFDEELFSALQKIARI